MHRNHDIFIQGIEQERRLELTFFNRKLRRQVISICAPLHYSKGHVDMDADSQDEEGCYYLWDFGAEKGNNFLALSPSQISRMELTEYDFHIKEFYSLNGTARKMTEESGIKE